MSLEETERTIRQYLDALLSGGDFAAFFADEVLWTTMETGDQIRGREAVKDFIVALHTQLFDASPELVSTEFADGPPKRCSSARTQPSLPASQRPVPRCGSLTACSMTSLMGRSSRCVPTSPSPRCSTSSGKLPRLTHSPLQAPRWVWRRDRPVSTTGSRRVGPDHGVIGWPGGEGAGPASSQPRFQTVAVPAPDTATVSAPGARSRANDETPAGPKTSTTAASTRTRKVVPGSGIDHADPPSTATRTSPAATVRAAVPARVRVAEPVLGVEHQLEVDGPVGLYDAVADCARRTRAGGVDRRVRRQHEPVAVEAHRVRHRVGAGPASGRVDQVAHPVDQAPGAVAVGEGRRGVVARTVGQPVPALGGEAAVDQVADGVRLVVRRMVLPHRHHQHPAVTGAEQLRALPDRARPHRVVLRAGPRGQDPVVGPARQVRRRVGQRQRGAVAETGAHQHPPGGPVVQHERVPEGDHVEPGRGYGDHVLLDPLVPRVVGRPRHPGRPRAAGRRAAPRCRTARRHRRRAPRRCPTRSRRPRRRARRRPPARSSAAGRR